MFDKDVVVFDLETTGTSVTKDRIVEYCFIKLDKSGNKKETMQGRVNPVIAIEPGASETHGITNDMVKNEPLFSTIAPQMLNFISGCDLAGFNIIKYDYPLLIEEFGRARINFPGDYSPKLFDSYLIYSKKERRDLTAALKFYCGKDIENAHSANADTEAATNVLLGQFKMYSDLNPENIMEFLEIDPGIDPLGYLKRNESGKIVFNFGKWNGYPVKEHIDYVNWVMGADFPSLLKSKLKNILK